MIKYKLPIVEKSTIDEWRNGKENVRDLRERISAIERENPELAQVMHTAEPAVNIEHPRARDAAWREDYSFNLGFLRAYEILRRQSEKDYQNNQEWKC